jgi:serine/threonine-protein kinase
LLPRGTIVAGYRIDVVLGEGAMSTVYRATQLSLSRVVALKLLAEELSADPGFRQRFQREGQLQATLDHEHIVTVYEAGQTDDGLFLAMRLIDGPTLKDLILDGDLSPGRSLRLLAQVAEALEEAHRAGLIHRDIKPQNILVGPDDHAYLADFGLIKSLDDADPLTRTGQFIGTIDYVAPEQVQGEPASPASDSYALAAVLFECLTGQVPFVRQNEAATIHAHVMAPPPLVSQLRPDLPGELDEVIAVGMAKLPDRRPSSPIELMRAAAQAFAAQPSQLDPIGGPVGSVTQSADGAGSQPTRVSRRPPVPRPSRSPAPPG